MSKTPRPWTDDEISELKRLRSQNLTYRAIAKIMPDRTCGAIAFRCKMLRLTPAEYEEYRKQDREKRRHSRPGSRAPKIYNVEQPSDFALADRARREALKPRDLTAAICGDPPVGYSAYDRKLLEARRDLN